METLDISVETKAPASRIVEQTSESIFQRINFQALKKYASSIMFTVLGFLILFIVGEIIHKLSNGEVPSPVATLKVFWSLVKNPFYDNGPNDKGIGLQLGSSLVRVFLGFGLGSLVAIPVGFLIGANSFCKKLFYPIIQILRPVSPLAWFPLGLAATHSVQFATIFVIFITSLWPTLINTSFGVASLPQDHKNVGKAFGFSNWKYITKILLPYSLPHIITGLRLSLGVAWLVIVASEMLSGGMGIGFFVWDSWNALSLEKVISAILIIGLVGLLFDKIFTAIEKKVSYGN
jgi:nitrate/nitrite transport system permease protein